MNNTHLNNRKNSVLKTLTGCIVLGGALYGFTLAPAFSQTQPPAPLASDAPQGDLRPLPEDAKVGPDGRLLPPGDGDGPRRGGPRDEMGPGRGGPHKGGPRDGRGPGKGEGRDGKGPHKGGPRDERGPGRGGPDDERGPRGRAENGPRDEMGPGRGGPRDDRGTSRGGPRDEMGRPGDDGPGRGGPRDDRGPRRGGPRDEMGPGRRGEDGPGRGGDRDERGPGRGGPRGERGPQGAMERAYRGAGELERYGQLQGDVFNLTGQARDYYARAGAAMLVGDETQAEQLARTSERLTQAALHLARAQNGPLPTASIVGWDAPPAPKRPVAPEAEEERAPREMEDLNRRLQDVKVTPANSSWIETARRLATQAQGDVTAKRLDAGRERAMAARALLEAADAPRGPQMAEAPASPQNR